MGEVYRARDDRLNRLVALKVLPADRVAASAERRRRFIQEAQLASALQHPNIVTIFDIGSTEGRASTSRWSSCAGGRSSTVITQSWAAAADAHCATRSQIVDALAAAHAAGIVHRDLEAGQHHGARAGPDQVSSTSTSPRSPTAATAIHLLPGFDALVDWCGAGGGGVDGGGAGAAPALERQRRGRLGARTRPGFRRRGCAARRSGSPAAWSAPQPGARSCHQRPASARRQPAGGRGGRADGYETRQRRSLDTPRPAARAHRRAGGAAAGSDESSALVKARLEPAVRPAVLILTPDEEPCPPLQCSMAARGNRA